MAILAAALDAEDRRQELSVRIAATKKAARTRKRNAPPPKPRSRVRSFADVLLAALDRGDPATAMEAMQLRRQALKEPKP